MLIRYSGRWAFITGGMYRRHLAQWPYGCRAFFSWTSSFAPQVAARYWAAVQRGDYEGAAAVVTAIEAPVFRLMSRYPERFQDILRGALELTGSPSGISARPGARLRTVRWRNSRPCSRRSVSCRIAERGFCLAHGRRSVSWTAASESRLMATSATTSPS